jgi:hypothetical protein
LVERGDGLDPERISCANRDVEMVDRGGRIHRCAGRYPPVVIAVEMHVARRSEIGIRHLTRVICLYDAWRESELITLIV